MGWRDLLKSLPPETRVVDASEHGLTQPILLHRLRDLGELVRVAANQREAMVLARHFSKVYGFTVTVETVQVAAVVSACWDGPSLEDIVQMSRHQGPLLLNLLRACNDLNGWEEAPFGTAGGGAGS
jgi:hypothetical protein